MKHFSKIFSMIIIFVLLFNLTVYCDTSGTLSKIDYNRDLVNTTYYNPNGQQNDIILFADDPGVGSVRITEYIGSATGWISADSLSAKPYNTIKTVALNIFKSVPVVGNVVATVESIISWVSTIAEDIIAVMDPTKNMDVTTKYAERRYEALIDVYDYNAAWTNVGWSTSKYYYRHTTVYYVNKSGNPKTTSAHDLDNIENPSRIAKSPLYKNFNALSAKAIEAWKNYSKFTDTY